VRAVIGDIMGHGNSPPSGKAILPGHIEAESARGSERAGGLLFSRSEIEALQDVSSRVGVPINPRPPHLV